jgi:hypothetical protein
VSVGVVWLGSVGWCRSVSVGVGRCRSVLVGVGRSVLVSVGQCWSVSVGIAARTTSTKLLWATFSLLFFLLWAKFLLCFWFYEPNCFALFSFSLLCFCFFEKEINFERQKKFETTKILKSEIIFERRNEF